MKKANVILGGGIGGLLLAKKLSSRGLKNIILIEASNEVGGLLKSISYENYGDFDYGTHYFTNTYGNEITNYLLGCLPKNEWQFHNGVRSDLSGNYYKGRLNLDTCFLDLTCDKDNISSFLHSIIMSQSRDKKEINMISRSAYDHLEKLYGKELTLGIFNPIIKKLFNHDIHEMDSFSVKLFPFSRLVLFPEKIAEDIIHTKILNKISAFPNQLRLPNSHHPKYSSFYPKKRGLQKVINSLKNQLKIEGVKIHTKTKITSINFNDKIVSVNLENNELKVENFFSTVSLVQLQKLFHIDIKDQLLDKPRHTGITNLCLNKLNETNSRHYIYCFDSEFCTYRITFYNNITLDNEDRISLTVESLHDQELDHDILNKKIVNELIKMGLIDNEKNVDFIDSKFLSYGFPLLTKNNLEFITNLRESIDKLNISNFYRFGVFSRPDIFFMKDIFKQINMFEM